MGAPDVRASFIQPRDHLFRALARVMTAAKNSFSLKGEEL